MPRVDRAHPPAIALLGALPRRVGLRKQPAGVEGDEVDIEPRLANVMEDDLILEAEACRERDRAPHLFAETHQAARNVEPGEHAVEVCRAVGEIIETLRLRRFWLAIAQQATAATIGREKNNVVRSRFETNMFHGGPRLQKKIFLFEAPFALLYRNPFSSTAKISRCVSCRKSWTPPRPPSGPPGVQPVPKLPSTVTRQGVAAAADKPVSSIWSAPGRAIPIF